MGRRDLYHLAEIAAVLHRRSVKAFDPFCLAAADAEGRGDVIGDVRRADRDAVQPDQHAACIEGHVGDARAHFDEGDAQVPFLFGQAGKAGRDGGRDDAVYIQISAAHAQV